MVTPITSDGKLDEGALDRLVDSLLAGGVQGIFIMGTTGEGTSIPRDYRLRLVQQAVVRVKHRSLIFAGIGDSHPEEITAGNDYFKAGVDAVVSQAAGGDFAASNDGMVSGAAGRIERAVVVVQYADDAEGVHSAGPDRKIVGPAIRN